MKENSNGKLNGKGKEYDEKTGKLKFEGEFISGYKKYGKEFNSNGILVYEGEFSGSFSFRNGKGKLYHENGKLRYEGEILEHRMNGIGKQYDEDGNLIFEGEFYFGILANGKMKKYYRDGKLAFEGEVLEKIIRNGKGFDKNGNVEFEINNGKGYIKQYDDNDKLEYEGYYVNGQRNGKGKYYYENGKIQYEGEFKNDKANGKGKEYDRKGNVIFEGEYLDSKRYNGKGIDKYNNEYELEDGKMI